MPVELLSFTPAYCIVGAYRLLHDPKLYKPIWERSKRSLQRAIVLAVPFLLVSLLLTRLWVTFILSRSPFSPKDIHNAAYLGVSPVTYTTFTLTLGQVSMFVEWMLARELRKSRNEVYERTVESRGKPDDWWQPYTEEWAVPPVARASRAAEKQSFYRRLSSPVVRLLLLKVLLTPLSFIPGLSLCILSSIRALTLGRYLHKPLFEVKKMSPSQIELWMTEREINYRVFGLVASLMERIPLVGLVFSISNRIGAAMWAHDLEKRQHQFRTGELRPTRVYQSKTARLAEKQAAVGIDPGVAHGPGGFPTEKGPVKIEGDGILQQRKPALPPR
ncbi:hypothetical protein BMF94_0149 [Rhodotorula taiwanensis]|uniref:Uncharacterized protein n=1 Tax=Rhodotorula taiwanensis TaxID=741276 RepID=A0A2S5BJF8_9BASI|nr:hypothetical protein BMF94_0149 [Rhodotorula taiwanensis]